MKVDFSRLVLRKDLSDKKNIFIEVLAPKDKEEFLSNFYLKGNSCYIFNLDDVLEEYKQHSKILLNSNEIIHFRVHANTGNYNDIEMFTAYCYAVYLGLPFYKNIFYYFYQECKDKGNVNNSYIQEVFKHFNLKVDSKNPSIELINDNEAFMESL